MLDATEQLVHDCEICVGVMGIGKDFMLISVAPAVAVEAEIEKAVSLGYSYCGVLGLKHGQPAVQCAPSADAIYTMMFAGLAFAQQCADHMLAAPKGDSAEWLQQLHNMQDTRPN